MERTIDNQLVDLKHIICEMGRKAQISLDAAIAGLVNKDLEKLKKVHETEKDVNGLHLRVDNSCMMVLAKLGPVARDLRMILSIVKMNADLERIGDQCVNIAHLSKDIIQRNVPYDFSEVQKMSVIASEMVATALKSFDQLDLKLAQNVLSLDDKVDHLRTEIVKKNIQLIKTDVQFAETYLDMIFIAKNLERMGDHATNIAEDVIFAMSGKDIRHGS